jgi:RNA polymerase sigma factor (sigma-70 family)
MDPGTDSSSTDSELLHRLMNGDAEGSWRDFLARYGTLIRGFARRQDFQAADCDDVLQEVLLGMSRVAPGFEYDRAKGKFRAYLKTIVIHAISKTRCQKRGRPQLEQIEETTRTALHDLDVEAMWEDEWRQHHLRQAMRVIRREFNEAEVVAFQTYAVEGHDAAEAAAETNMSVGYVYTIKSRILKRLKELVEQQIREEG